MMTMTGLILGVGMVVDASVVVLENIYQYRERGTKPTIAAVLGTQEVFASVLSGNLTTICVFIPIILFKSDLGFIGQLFTDLIFTIIIALVSSLFVAIFLVPVLSSKFLSIKTRAEKPLKKPTLIRVDGAIERWLAALSNLYEGALRTVLKRRKTTVIVVLGLFLVSLATITRLNVRLIPNMSDDSVTLEVELPLGTKLDDTNAVLQQLEAIVRESFGEATGDAAAKAAAVDLIEIRLANGIGGKAVLTLTGSVADVEAAIQAGEAAIAHTGLFVAAVIIPAPHGDVQKFLV